MPSPKLCMNSCINLSACTHLQRVHHPGTRTPSTGIHFSCSPVGDEARPWVGWGNYRENQAGLWETNRRGFYLVEYPLVFLFVWYMRGVLHNWLDGNLQNRAVKCYEHGESICIFTASVWGSIFGPEGTFETSGSPFNTPWSNRCLPCHAVCLLLSWCPCHVLDTVSEAKQTFLQPRARTWHPGGAGAADTASSKSSKKNK